MLFNSFEFLFFFLPAALLGYQLASRFGGRAVVSWLALASLVFYARWRPLFVVFLVFSILLNYTTAVLIQRAKENEHLQKIILYTGIAIDLLLLCYFKYLFPFLNFLNQVGWTTHSWEQVVLPLGISFFTFTQIGYLIDLQEGQAEPQDLIGYTLFVTFFPHLIAGPILHHREMMPQFSRTRRFSLAWNDFSIGLTWFVLGLCKKVLLADRIAPVANFAFAHTHSLSWFDAWVGALAYVIQLYFDFSGYSDMAIGLARMFGIRFPLNFNSPYKAPDIINYWQRWHMTLTRYLTMYLYNPISLNINRRRMAAGKKTSKKAVATLPGFLSMIATPTLTTMFLAGIWHGAGLTFLIFGVLHGFYLTVNHAWRIFQSPSGVLTRLLAFRPLSILVTFVCVVISEVFFRATNTADAFALLAAMFGIPVSSAAPSRVHGYGTADLLFLGALLIVVQTFPNTQEILGQVEPAHGSETLRVPDVRWRPTLVWSAALGCLLVLVFAYMTNSSAFLYFQF